MLLLPAQRHVPRWVRSPLALLVALAFFECAHGAVERPVETGRRRRRTPDVGGVPGVVSEVAAVTEGPRLIQLRLERAPFGGVALAERGLAGAANAKAAATTAAAAGKQNPADWFRAFSEGESTYDTDAALEGDREERLRGLRQLGAMEPGEPPEEASAGPSRAADGSIASRWFDESPSGGARQAWQTHYPSLEDLHPRGAVNEHWSAGPNGRWHQKYDPPGNVGSEWKPAGWFDSSVTHYDAFGRVREPSHISGRRYPLWQERSRNVTLTCAAAGCIANATLVAADLSAERATRCLLSVAVHATDFDDEFSRENVEWIMVNNRTVNTVCDPGVKACNATAQAPLHNCLVDFVVPEEMMREQKGTLQLAAKLSPMVDECPHEGNLLSGVATVTCLVAAPEAPPTPVQLPVVPPLAPEPPRATRLRCDTPGCIGNLTVRVPPPLNGTSRSCLLTVQLQQTDFEAENEIVEWVKVDGDDVVSNVNPGQNPCKARMEGQNVSDVPFPLVAGQDVTAAAADGEVLVSAKLSPMVDECGHDGFLLDAQVVVNCTAT